MRTKTQFILLIGGLMLLLSILLFVVFQENKLYFLICEVGIILLTIIAFRVYQAIFRPFDFLKQGREAMMDEDFNVRIAPNKSPDMNALINIYNQMLDKIRSERVFQREQHYFLDSLLDVLPVGILILDYDDRITQFNHLASQYLNLRTEDKGLLLTENTSALQGLLTQLKIGQEETIKIGSVHYYRCFARQFMHRGFARKYYVIEDLSTELLKVEKQAYGKVIRMMAHEVNNSIGAINSILHSLISGQNIDPQEIREYLPIVIDRNDGLASFMKNFASVIRLPLPSKKPCDLATILYSIVKLYQNRGINRSVDISIVSAPETYIIHADKDQIEQALVNILQNSIEAIADHGWIKIYLDPQKNQLRIIDNGKGISPEEAKDLFTPFYSTKADGQGIGLTLVKQILYNHGFDFSLASHDSETVFEIRALK